jgi:hypothetical protein
MKKNIGFVLCLAGVAILAACAPISAAYRITPAPATAAGATAILVTTLEDARPDEEKSGAGAGLFNKSTKDSLYDGRVDESITNALADELKARGLDPALAGTAGYRLTGVIKSYRAIIVPPRTSFIPYVSYVTWLWTNDRIGVSVDIDLTLNGPQGPIYTRNYKTNENIEEWVGLAGLASRARRMDREHLVKLLRASLQEVLGRAADDVAGEIKRR